MATATTTGNGTSFDASKFPTGNYVESSPVVVNGVVYVGSLDGKVYAFGLK
jgi:outer membrane protein assembly factor BamB